VLVNIAAKENAQRQKQQRAKEAQRSEQKRREAEQRAAQDLPPLHDEHEHRHVVAADPKSFDVEKALHSAGKAGSAAGAMLSVPSSAQPDAAKASEKSPAARTVGALLALSGGINLAAAPPAAAAQASKSETPAPASSGSSGSSGSKSGPANNTFEPLSHAPEGGLGKGLSLPVRLQDSQHVQQQHHLNNEEEATELQRNYANFVNSKKKQTSASAGGRPSDDSTDKSGSDAAAPDLEPDSLPLFIIDGFNADNASKHNNFLNTLVAWSAEMSAVGAARFN